MRESALLEHIYRANPESSARIAIPPGDDMGALTLAGVTVLATVDQLADGVHADTRTMSLAKIGRKAVLRNLSDVAAMGAKPCGAIAAASLPRDFGQGRANALFDAMRTVAADSQCPLFGGDISTWDHPLLLSVTVLAEPAGIEPVLRQGAQVGDCVYVTGALGGSLETVAGYCHHLDFEPRVTVARTLAGDQRTRPHAMIDLSDGLDRDAVNLAQASGLWLELDAARLPISDGGRQAAARTGQPPWWHAIADGEDYELLFTACENAMPSQVGGVPIRPIGRVVSPAEAPGASLILDDGRQQILGALGWEHHG
jgi:thiamine-monophosphate kinase